jgi:hypothetical protein
MPTYPFRILDNLHPSKSYALVLAEYVQRFHSRPPLTSADDAAIELMLVALLRGAPISELDLSPQGPTVAPKSA